MKKKKLEESFKETLYLIEKGIRGGTKEDFEYEKEKCKIIMQEDIEQFQFLMNNTEQHARIMQELERRKAENTQHLREYGFEV